MPDTAEQKLTCAEVREKILSVRRGIASLEAKITTIKARCVHDVTTTRYDHMDYTEYKVCTGCASEV